MNNNKIDIEEQIRLADIKIEKAKSIIAKQTEIKKNLFEILARGPILGKDKVIPHKIKGGKIKKFDISKKIFELFGAYYGDIIETPLQNKATVLGINNGNLWYINDGDDYATYWSRKAKTRIDLEKAGFKF